MITYHVITCYLRANIQTFFSLFKLFQFQHNLKVMETGDGAVSSSSHVPFPCFALQHLSTKISTPPRLTQSHGRRVRKHILSFSKIISPRSFAILMVDGLNRESSGTILEGIARRAVLKVHLGRKIHNPLVGVYLRHQRAIIWILWPFL
jgi:hypothetical protein